MFEHLPTISEDNLTVFKEKELLWFVDLMKGVMKTAKNQDEAIDLACGELHRNNNPYLVKAVRGCIYGVVGEIEDEVEPGIEWRAGLAVIPGILAILYLIDRAIQAQQLKAQLLQKSRLKNR